MRELIECDGCKSRIDVDSNWGNCNRCERDLCEVCAGKWTELDPDGQGCCVCAECLVALAKEGFTRLDLMNAGLCKVESPEQLSSPSTFVPGIKEIIGDLFDHVKPGDVICHIVNNEGAWGSEFVVPLGKKYPMAKEAYLGWCDVGNVALGKCLFVACGGDISVVNMCAQNGLIRASNPRPLSYSALRHCLTEVAARISPDRRILMPRIGAGLGGGDWSTIFEIITETLGDRDVTVFVLPGQN